MKPTPIQSLRFLSGNAFLIYCMLGVDQKTYAEYISSTLYKKLKSNPTVIWSKLDKSLESLEWLEKNYASLWRKDYQPTIEIIQKQNLKVGCEIGVAFGSQSIEILRKTDATLYSIDPFLPMQNNLHLKTLTKHEWDILSIIVESRLSGFKKRSHLIKKHPRIAMQYVQDNMLDFLCIDARYACQDIGSILSSWYSKVKKEGYFFITGKPGTDITKQTNGSFELELENFCTNHNLDARITHHTYCIQKKEH